jgi:predicted acyltransferase
MWIMGVSMSLSFSSIKITNDKVDQSAWNHVFRRSTILILLGAFLNNGYNLSKWRIPGNDISLSRLKLKSHIDVICY